MDVVLYISGSILTLVGLLGCIIPGLPGPPLNFLALLCLQFSTARPFDSRFMYLWAAITVIVTVLDYVVPVIGTKKFGGSGYGTAGSFIGMIAGIFIFPPWGIIIGPFLGAFIGEIISGKDSRKALVAGFGSFIGFVFGTILKLITAGVMTWYFFYEMFASF
ncbi:MAG TPA: DUF456 domain-containing protein [Cyclobacteriaceae bacterium]|nr:DUF456 domain-containing protein [Cyclobacteriaceae bacterium]